MKSNVMSIIGIALIVVGAIFGAFSFPAASIVSMIVALFGAGLACAGTWKDRKPETPTWVSILAMVFLGLGAFLAGFIGFLGAETTLMVKIVTGVISLALIIAGVVMGFKPKEHIAVEEEKK